MFTVAECLVECHLSEDGAQGGHHQLLDSKMKVLDTVDGIAWVGDTDECHSVGQDNGIVTCDDLLLGDVEDDIPC